MLICCDEKIVVYRGARSLDDEDIILAHVLTDANLEIVVGPALDVETPWGAIQVGTDFLGEFGIAATGHNLQVVLHWLWFSAMRLTDGITAVMGLPPWRNRLV